MRRSRAYLSSTNDKDTNLHELGAAFGSLRFAGLMENFKLFKLQTSSNFKPSNLKLFKPQTLVLPSYLNSRI